jgi:hypothetical protein
MPAMPFPFPSALQPSVVLSDEVVEVDLVRGDGDPRPRIHVQLDEREAPVLAVLDLGGGEVRIGSLLAARLGVKIEGRTERTAILPWLRIGELVVNDVRAVVVSGQELYVGAGALPGLAVAVRTDHGEVWFSQDADELLASVGPVVPFDPPGPARWRERAVPHEGPVPGALFARLQGSVAVQLRLRSDRSATTLSDPGLAPEVRQAGRPGAYLGLTLGTEDAPIELPARFYPWDESVSDPRPQVCGELGADVLAGLEVAVDPAGGRLALAWAHSPHWTDSDGVRAEGLERAAASWEPPVPGTGDVLARSRWADLAAARWEVGDVQGALQADQVLAGIAGERCELWQVIGTRALRAGEASAEAALQRAGAAREAWEAASRGQRARVRAGKASEPSEPRSECRGAPEPVPSGEGALRAALAEGRGAPPVRAALARTLYEQGRVEPALAAVQEGLGPDPHPLVTALVLGPELLGVTEPPSLAERVAAGLVRTAHGEPDPELAGPLEELRLVRPGDPSVLCQVALYDALLGPAELPPFPEADCLAARALLALHERRVHDVERHLQELGQRWPDLFGDDPWLDPVRMVGHLEAR